MSVTTASDQHSPQCYDYVVIGAGSAGCIVAARLAEHHSVLLLEAGEPATKNPETLSADGFKYAFANDDLMWHRMTLPQAAAANRRLYAGTGRGMGGSGSVNGMVYTRGDKRDFAHWPAGWRWEELSPAFAAVEEQLGIRSRPATPFAQRFIDASTQAGFQRKDGMNDGELAAVVGCNDMNYAGDNRRSSYAAYLHDRPLPNLKIITGALTQRLVFDDSHTAKGVEYRANGMQHRADVRGEIILCAGALETPKLLMLSGVGPRAELEAHGIPAVLDAPGVGKNLQDHPNVCLFYRTRENVDFSYPQVYAFDTAERQAGETPSAPDTCFVCYAAPASIKQSMLRMVPVLALPGPLYAIRPLRRLLRGIIHAAFALPSLKRYVAGVFGIVVILGKPTSRGSLRLASANPADSALIDPNYYATEQDRQTMAAGVSKARRIAGQKALEGARPLSAGARQSSGKKLWGWINAATMTTFHYCGSCRMGEDDNSPVDTQLRVKGLKNVRVADASVMPEIPVSALNSPSMMIGYRAADFILAERNQTHHSRDAA